MRYLFTFAGGTGHFLPTVPMARALRDRGHDIVYACQQAMTRPVEDAGFTAYDTGGNTLLDASTRLPLVPVDREAERRVARDVFAGRIARERARHVTKLARDLQPHVIVRDEMDFGAALAAESMGIVHAAVTVIAAGGFVTRDLVEEPLSAARAELGLEADPEVAMVHRYLTLTPVPPSFRDPDDPLPATAHVLRPEVLAGPSVINKGRARSRPSVYFTLGTVFHQESGDLFTRVLDGLGALDLDVLVTIGRELDPAELGAQPPNVSIERFVPLATALTGCDAVVSHAGSGTVIASLACGLPSVLLPMGADQPWTADRCRALGVSQVLDALTTSPAEVAAATTEVLASTDYRTAAERLRDEIADLPDVSYGADLLERLASERQPILGDE